MCHKSPRCSAVERWDAVVPLPGCLPGGSQGYGHGGPRASQVEHLEDLAVQLVLKLGPVGGKPHEDDAGVDGCGWCLALRGHVSRIPDGEGVVKDS